MDNADFPALSMTSTSNPNQTQPSISFSSITQQQQPHPNQKHQTQQPLNDASQFPALGAQSRKTNPQQNNPIITSGDKYGLFGLINVIRMTDQDTNMVALGLDIPSLGLSLNSVDPIHSKFMSPFTNDPFIGSEPVYKLPSAYSLDVPIDILSRLPNFTEETLFYCFYSMCRSSVQEASAQELFMRGWRFHVDLKLWLTKEQSDKKNTSRGAGERSVFIFFDAHSWVRVKKEWTLVYSQLEDRGFVFDEDGHVDVWKCSKQQKREPAT